MIKRSLFCAFALGVSLPANSLGGGAQQPAESKPADQGPKKANSRVEPATAAEPFDGASVEKMAAQCVTFETEAGIIEIELLAEMAPESTRNFLNLVSIGAFDATTFSRVIPGFVIQGGNVASRSTLTQELLRRAQKTVPDEPNIINHVRGIVSLARTDQPNSSSSHFFILVGDAPYLDGKFSAFGRFAKGWMLRMQSTKHLWTARSRKNPYA